MDKLKKLTQEIDFGKVYRHNLKGQIKFGIIPEEALYELFRDGRAVAPPIQLLLSIWFPELKFVDKVEHDYLHMDDEKIRFEHKSFTSHGLLFAPSHMTGKGRTIEPERFRACAQKTIYIICDVTSFPKINIVFKDGKELFDAYPKGKVPFCQKHHLFGQC